jgi:hypothetical protein
MENKCSPATGKIKSIKVFFGDKFAEDHFEARDYRGNPFPITGVSYDCAASNYTVTLNTKLFIRMLATERKRTGFINRLKRNHFKYKIFEPYIMDFKIV